jgi:hypothetical protein
MQKCRFLVYTITFSFVTTFGFSQGCSDAGFCTMGAMKPDQPFNKKVEFKLRSMELSFYRGTTTMTPIVYVATADLNFSLSRKTFFQVKLPYQAVTGKLANTGGAGDISVCITRNVFNSEKSDVNFSLGAKIPSNDSDLKEGGRPLPMYYQTSLGTYDVIAGISYITKQWLLATGIQIPLNKNKNDFLWGQWADTPENEYVVGYSKAKALKRGTDVMVRVERNFRFSRLNFTIGLLPIYRITNDEITGPLTGKIGLFRQKADGAKGLALSAIFTTGYSFNVRSGIKALIGHKIVQRDNNPDGLTRELVTTMSYYYRF